eukprot:c21941_g1_i1 orf=440-2173(-)
MGLGKQSSPLSDAKGYQLGSVAGRHAQMKSSMNYSLEWEELLLGRSNATMLDPSKADPAVIVRNPNTSPSPRELTEATNPAKQLLSPRGRTPLQSPRFVSPLRSTKGSTEVDLLHCQETSPGEASLRKIPAMPRVEDVNYVPDINARGTRLDFGEGQRRSPFNSSIYTVEEDSMEEQTISLPRKLVPGVLQAAHEKGIPISPDWALRDRGRSHTREKLPVVEMQNNERPLVVRSSLRSSKSVSRKGKTEQREYEEGDLAVGDKGRVTRRTHSRPHSTHSRPHNRQHKRSEADPVSSLAIALPESCPSQKPMPAGFEPICSSPVAAAKTVRMPRSSFQRADWLQFAEDVIMWRHIPRSSFLFGVGCFVSSTSAMQEIRCSIITVVAYIALVYLVAVFFQRSITKSFEMDEADAVKIIRVILPALNIALSKLSQLFSGEPVMTLKVAAALWLLAQAGYIMNFWTFARLAYFALFIIPKCYSCYRTQLHGHAVSFLLWSWTTWEECSHKKAIVFVICVMGWNISSFPSRICGAFIFIVAFRAYKQFFRSQQAYQNMTSYGRDRPLDMNLAVPQYVEMIYA